MRSLSMLLFKRLPAYILSASLLSFLFTATAHSQWVRTNGPYGGTVYSFAVNGTNLFAGTYGDVFLSTNNGSSWTEASTGLTNTAVEVLVVSGTNLFAGTYGGGVFRSTNNGTSWTAANTGLADTLVQSLAVSGTNLFVGTFGGGVFRSTNNGTSWTAVNTGLTNTFVQSLAVSGTNLFAGTQSGVFLSTNNGTSWTAAVLTNSFVFSLAVIGTNLFAATMDGVFRSTNNGTSWTAANTGLTTNGVDAFVVSGTNLFAGTYDGVFLSTNNGTSWTAVNTGLTNTRVHSLVVSPAPAGNLFAGTGGGGVFYSTNNGTSWIAVNTGLTNSAVLSLAVSPAPAGNLFAGTGGGGVFYSTNNGTSWIATGLTNATGMSLAVSGTNLFAGTWNGVFLSTNNGTSWTAVNTGLTNTAVFSLAVSGTNLFAGTWGGGVFRSTNNGTSWTAASTGLTNTYIEDLAVSGTNLFAGTRGGGVFLSTNNGASWTAASSGLTNTNVSSFAVSGTNLFAGTLGGGVFLSTNNGASWTAASTGLTSTKVYSFAVIPAPAGNLFAGTDDGVFLSTNNGTSWTTASSGLTNIGVISLAVSGTNLFAGTEGRSVWRRPLAEMITTSNMILTYNQIDAAAFPTITSYVTVNDLAGSPIAGLASSNFSVQENGVTQSPIYVSLVGGTGASISVALVIDRSGSMTGSRLPDAKNAAITFVRQMRAGDRAAVYSFDQFVYLNQDFTGDTSRLISAINALTLGGSTAIYDAMLESVTRTSQQVGRKAVILLTDGADNASRVTVDSAINYANQQSIPVYTIGLGLNPGSAEELVLERIAQQTGGVFYRAPSSSDLARIYQSISQQLQNQYSIIYRANNQARDGSVRTVTVSVSYSNQTDSKQRQYTAPSGQSLAPRIVFVRDVPHDQGGKVLIKWQASALDTNVTTLPSYSVWRAVPEGMRSSISGSSEEQAPGGITFRQTMVNDALMAWEFLANLPAHRFTAYTYAASTLYDSMSTTNGRHYFLVSAHSNNANVFYDSNVDSGYSVDNIPPFAPRNLVGNSLGGKVTLSWRINPDADLRHYVIYRTLSANFNADTVRSLATVQDTVFIDQNPIVGTSYYFVRAQDIHDNLSPISAVLPFTINNVSHDPMTIPHEFSIFQNNPNPFNPSTTIKFALPERANVNLFIYNLLGEKVAELVNGEMEAGYHEAQWNASSFASGVYLYTLRAGKFVETKKLILLR